ncbi:MAG TPA: GNAT family N-acetyltransferase [Thermoanaerobaculia bacterium]|nr:GNAT family N-acetyltransferase [Thermoanaerobaculia bacterium]
MTILETGRLLLRHAHDGDAEFFLELLNDPSFVENIGDRGVRTPEQARRYIQERLVASYERHGFGMYVVERKESPGPIGICGLVRRDTLPDADVGFAFLPRYWSKGYAVESAAAVMTYGREALGLGRIVAVVNPANQGSIRVLEKLGLRLEGMIRMPGEAADIQLFGPEG